MKKNSKLLILTAVSVFCIGAQSHASAELLIPADATRLSARTACYSKTNRPPESERLFKSAAVEAEIARVKSVLTNSKLAWMFENCFPNTLDTTVRYRKDDDGKDDTVVYTGDIPRHVAPGLGGAGVALSPACEPRRTSARHARGRHSPSNETVSSSIPTPMLFWTPTTLIRTTSG